MRKLLLLAILVSTPALAQHGGLWHEPSGQPYNQQPQGYSKTDSRSQQQEYERQLRRERELKRDRKPNCRSKSLMC